VLEVLDRTRCPFRSESKWSENSSFCEHPLRKERNGHVLCQSKYEERAPSDFPVSCPLTDGETVRGA